jgi:MoxR-like ATPase
VIATANTKGKGSDDGRFIGTNVLNEAFLERFPVTFEQAYPTPKVETAILKKAAESLNAYDEEFVSRLVAWAEIIRKTFYDGGVDEIISTRRLVHVIRALLVSMMRPSNPSWSSTPRLMLPSTLPKKKPKPKLKLLIADV